MDDERIRSIVAAHPGDEEVLALAGALVRERKDRADDVTAMFTWQTEAKAQIATLQSQLADAQRHH
jgi:hypothetical protein